MLPICPCSLVRIGRSAMSNNKEPKGSLSRYCGPTLTLVFSRRVPWLPRRRVPLLRLRVVPGVFLRPLQCDSSKWSLPFGGKFPRLRSDESLDRLCLSATVWGALIRYIAIICAALSLVEVRLEETLALQPGSSSHRVLRLLGARKCG